MFNTKEIIELCQRVSSLEIMLEDHTRTISCLEVRLAKLGDIPTKQGGYVPLHDAIVLLYEHLALNVATRNPPPIERKLVKRKK